MNQDIYDRAPEFVEVPKSIKPRLDALCMEWGLPPRAVLRKLIDYRDDTEALLAKIKDVLAAARRRARAEWIAQRLLPEYPEGLFKEGCGQPQP